jgi:hypothetical protein
MNTPLIYLAAPYSHSDNYVRHRRFLEINRVTGHLFSKGLYVFSPISHTHPIKETCNLDGGWEFWAGYDRKMIEVSDFLYVLTLEGWKDSIGVTAEIKLASIVLNKPVSYIHPLTLLVTPTP